MRGPPLDVYVNLHGGKPSETAMRKSQSVSSMWESMRTNTHPFCFVRSIQRRARRLVHRRLLRYRDDRQRGIQRRSVVVVISRPVPNINRRVACGGRRIIYQSPHGQR